jgi:hypothetical protein
MMNTSSHIASSWYKDEDSVMMVTDDEEFSVHSRVEACQVLEDWQALDGVPTTDVPEDIMQIDAEITLLGDDIFKHEDDCLSPTCPLEELVYMGIHDMDRFATSLAMFDDDDDDDDEADENESSSFEERATKSMKRLQESMKRSQETRKTFQQLATSRTKLSTGTRDVQAVLKSIETSSKALQKYMTELRPECV